MGRTGFHTWRMIGVTALILWFVASASGQTIYRTPDAASGVLSPQEWARVDTAVARALAWLAAQQQADGSFPTLDTGQPGVTCLCMLAFMAHGHLPGEGPYGEQLKRASEYALRCQKPNGLVTLIGPEGPQISREIHHDIGSPCAYNHGISSLTLSELYGATPPADSEHLKDAILLALRATLEMQRWPKDREIDLGGWRYIDNFDDKDSDLSITGWQLMFLRSARNAGFDVPEESIDDAVAYVRRTFTPRYGAFCYVADENVDFRSRGMAGAGILALAHAGYHNAPEATQSGEWILQHNFNDYNEIEPFQQGWKNDRYHYGLFNCCQAMYQIGGRYWQQFFPGAVKTLLANQQPDGSWPAENHHHDAQFGNAYTTALVLLTLGAPNQLLPIYQR
ncbi:MAG TPA: prenyltransferase/squalene oxidase repeat-containing protein [Lacipirellulaceae bacterium]|nr:prenyltransferase/squalene oxidase repeat-containing protein [Lacipirellulaceae bacterium]